MDIHEISALTMKIFRRAFFNYSASTFLVGQQGSDMRSHLNVRFLGILERQKTYTVIGQRRSQRQLLDYFIELKVIFPKNLSSLIKACEERIKIPFRKRFLRIPLERASIYQQFYMNSAKFILSTKIAYM